MSTPPALQQSSRSSTGALSQQPTLVPSQSAEGVFKEALQAFCNRLTGDELAEFKKASYENFCDDLNKLQEDQKRSKQLKNLRRIEPFIEAMQHLGKTIEIFLNVHNGVAFIWGPVKFLLLTASVWAESFETLLDVYEHIGQQLPLLNDYKTMFSDDVQLNGALVCIYTDILTFHQHAIRWFRCRKLKHIFQSMWKSFDTEFQGILQSLKRHKDLVERRVSVSQYRRYQEDMSELKTNWEQYRTDTLDFKARMQEQVAQENLKRLITVKEWLAVASQAEEDHKGFREIRQINSATATWILDHSFVKDWLGAVNPTTPWLWMHGIPGAGKTILASAIIDKCCETRDFKTGYFYCHDADQTSSTALSILTGLAEQLLLQDLDLLLPHFFTRRSSGGDVALRSVKQADKLLEDCCKIVPKVFLIVDGLDECIPVERKEILVILMKLSKACEAAEPGKLRILIVSQQYPDIYRLLHNSATMNLAPRVIQLSDEAHVENDIRKFVKTWVDKIASKHNPFSEDMKEYLRNLTLANAKGMFLYAKLVLENLHALNTREKVVHGIQHENFPDGLKEAYDRIIRRIKDTSSKEDWKDATKLLGWMVCAKRQLTWKEMQVALSIDIDEQTIEYDDRHLRTHIHEICGALVTMSGDRVTLVHSTAKTYITKETKDIHEPTIECELATLCLQYLTFPCFDTNEHDDENELRRLMLEGHFAFQDYAVAKWFYHVNAFVKSGQNFLNDAVDSYIHLDALTTAVDDFMTRYEEEDWGAGLVENCKSDCSAFEEYRVHENLLLLTSHIYTFQQKGFEARHKISIKSLSTALERNRKLLEELPAKLNDSEKEAYCKFYDDKRKYKCTKITCRYFSQGFSDKKAKKKHIDLHDRPYRCEVSECLGGDGFTNEKDLKNHTRAYHPEMSDLADTFTSTLKRAKAAHACTICGQTFTRNFHRLDHEKSHRGERPHACPECGRAFTRMNDLKRHQKLHERGR